MKKAFCTAWLTLFLAAGLMAASITITWPNGGERIMLNTDQSIRWNPVDIPAGTTADIYLLKGGSEVRRLIHGCRADVGHTPWPVIGDLDEGTDYRIRIRVLGMYVSDESDRDFTLAASTAAGDLELVGLSGEGGKVHAHIRSTFPSFNRPIYYEIKRPDWAPTRTGRFYLNVAFSEPGEKDYSLENILPTNLLAGGDIIHSRYEVTLDPENAIAETNERNNRQTAALCGHRVFPVIEKVLFGGQEAQRNQLLEVRNGRVVGIYETPADKRQDIRTPWEVYLKVRVLIRNYGWEASRGKMKISQIGIQRRAWSSDGGSGGYLPEYQERQVSLSDFTLPGIPDLKTYESLELKFYLDNTDVLIEYLWREGGAHTAMSRFRFPVSFREMIREYEPTH